MRTYHWAKSIAGVIVGTMICCVLLFAFHAPDWAAYGFGFIAWWIVECSE